MIVDIYNFNEILERLFQGLTLLGEDNTFGKLATKLEMNENTLLVRKSRKSIPYNNIILFCKKYHLSLDWILLNRKDTSFLQDKDPKPYDSSLETFGIEETFASFNILINEESSTFIYSKLELYQALLNVKKDKIKSSYSRKSIPYREIVNMCDAKYIPLDWFFDIKPIIIPKSQYNAAS